MQKARNGDQPVRHTVTPECECGEGTPGHSETTSGACDSRALLKQPLSMRFIQEEEWGKEQKQVGRAY